MRIAAMVIGAVASGGCTCIYGGPGCGDPGIVGMCGGEVELGRSTATVMYGDDTGEHPSKVGHAEAVPADRLFATVRDPTIGELELFGFAEGPAELRIRGVEGLDDTTFFYTVNVKSSVAACTEDYEGVLPDGHAP